MYHSPQAKARRKGNKKKKVRTGPNHKTGQATEQAGLSTQQAATDRTQPKIGLTHQMGKAIEQT